ncbi:MAG: hypothetical protein F6J93_27000 [Oscillatoria sp. SIO1A7]|nr:hypothetical protein [Oscillatoria sp. SIO1A7]
MLSQDDKDKLIEFGNQCKEAKQSYKEEELFSIEEITICLKHNKTQLPDLLYFMTTDDDQKIDEEEANLLNWVRKFVRRIRPTDIEEAIELIKQGFHSN